MLNDAQFSLSLLHLDSSTADQIAMWFNQKGFKDQDLDMRRLLSQDSDRLLWIRGLARCGLLRASFAETLHIMEILTDLIAMGHTEGLFLEDKDLETWRQNLRTLRYPNTQKRDAELRTHLEALPWPHGSKVKFERRGDRSGIELKIFISSPVDITKIMAALERVREEL
jgi:hypothetical protein